MIDFSAVPNRTLDEWVEDLREICEQASRMFPSVSITCDPNGANLERGRMSITIDLRSCAPMIYKVHASGGAGPALVGSLASMTRLRDSASALLEVANLIAGGLENRRYHGVGHCPCDVCGGRGQVRGVVCSHCDGKGVR